jgi:hypothetical protein
MSGGGGSSPTAGCRITPHIPVCCRRCRRRAPSTRLRSNAMSIGEAPCSTLGERCGILRHLAVLRLCIQRRIARAPVGSGFFQGSMQYALRPASSSLRSRWGLGAPTARCASAGFPASSPNRRCCCGWLPASKRLAASFPGHSLLPLPLRPNHHTRISCVRPPSLPLRNTRVALIAPPCRCLTLFLCEPEESLLLAQARASPRAIPPLLGRGG